MLKGESVLILNQTIGPLLRDFVNALAEGGAKCKVLMGRDPGNEGDFGAGVLVQGAPRLNRKSIPTRLFSWLAYFFAAVPQLLRCNKDVRVVLFSNPPILPVCGWICSLVRGYRYSVVVYDVYPDMLVEMGWLRAGTLLTRAWHRLNRATYERAFAVITLGEAMESVLSEHFDPRRTAVGKIIISRPWADTAAVFPVPKAQNVFASQNTSTGHVSALCSGNMGESHDIDTILRAAALMESEDQVEFLLVGGALEFLGSPAELRSLRNLRILPWQPEQNVPSMWAAAEIALITLRPGFERCSFPSRTAFALSAGCAIIGITHPNGDLARLIDQTGCGIVVEPGNAGKLADCLRLLSNNPKLLRRYRNAARAAAEDLFGRDNNLAAMMRGVPQPAETPIKTMDKPAAQNLQ
jgi:colanic acid biosynthesis glycosyl transferase WcaI